MPSPSLVSRPPRPAILLMASLIAAAIGTGCGSSKSTYLYSAPDDYDVRSESLVDAGFDEVWDRLMEAIRASDWKLGAEDRDHGKIQFTIPGADPGLCVDCGRLTRGTEEFEVARSATEKGAGSEKSRLTQLEARVSLDIGRHPSGTKVHVDVWYVLDVDDRYFSRVKVTDDRTVKSPITDEKGEVIGYSTERIPGKTSTISRSQQNTIHFTTAGGDSANWGTPEEPLTITCRSTGRLEQSILDLASGQEERP